MQQRDRLTITLKKSILQQLDGTIDGREVRNRSHAIEKILAEAFGDAPVKKAIILGGGAGVMVDGKKTSPLLIKADGGKRMIDLHFEKLHSVGVEEFILSVGAFGDDVREYVGDGARYDLKVIYFEHDHGTASALRQARMLLSDTFIMINGHVKIHEIDIVDMVLFHKRRKAALTMALASVEDPTGLGQVHLRGTHISAFADKSNDTTFDVPSHIVNAGLYIVEPRVCEYVRPDEEMIERDLIPELIKEHSVCGYVIDVPWQKA